MVEHAWAYASAVSMPFANRPWRAKVPMEIRQSRYIIKTASSAEEFRKVIHLRSQVFLQEFAGKVDHAEDLEERDDEADFLIIQDAASQEVLASYRLICSDYSTNFYSETEFQIHDFLRQPGKKLELSRACVRADKRSSGIFVHLLWRGLAEYIRLTQSRFLFGCSSIQTLELKQLVRIYRYLQQENALSNEFRVAPLPAYSIIDAEGIIAMRPAETTASDEGIPALLLAYLRAGAKVYGAPAFDQDFGCLDLFTVLDFEDMSAGHMRKYLQQT